MLKGLGENWAIKMKIGFLGKTNVSKGLKIEIRSLG